MTRALTTADVSAAVAAVCPVFDQYGDAVFVEHTTVRNGDGSLLAVVYAEASLDVADQFAHELSEELGDALGVEYSGNGRFDVFFW